MMRYIHNMTMVQPIRLPSFRRLFAGESIAVFADQMLLVALTILALRVAGPGFALGSVLAVAAIPGAVLMPFGGWMSDRFSPAGVLFLCGAGRTLLASALASLVFLEVSSVWPLYALGGTLGVLNALYYPASLSTVPAVLGDRALLGAGNALVLGIQQVSEMAGPVLAASVVALFGVGAVFGANALMFGAAAVLFGMVACSMPSDTAVCTVIDPPASPGMLVAENPSPASASMPPIVQFNRTANRCTRRATGSGSTEKAAYEESLQEREELTGSEEPSEMSHGEVAQGPVAGIVEGLRYA